MNDIGKKLDKIDDRLGSIDVHLAKYNTQLEYHIDRTDRLEALVVEAHDALKPLQAHVEQWNGAGKLLAWTSLIASIVAGLAWIWTK